jgi:hypothetical protein
MATMTVSNTQGASEHELRRLIDRSLSRALFDSAYAAHLLADPTVALVDSGCTPQQRRDLRAIRARTLREFAKQAEELFWIGPLECIHVHDIQLAAAAI